MSLQAKLLGLAELQNYLVVKVPEFRRGVYKNMQDLARLIVNEVKVNYLSGRNSPNEPKLNTRTGNLRRQIRFEVTRGTNPMLSKDSYTATIGTNVKYGLYNHEGAVIPARRIYPNRKKALAWIPSGDKVNRFQANMIRQFNKGKKNFKKAGGLTQKGRQTAINAGLFAVAKYVDIPTTRIPARPFLTTVLENNKLAIMQRLFFEMNAIYGRKR